MSNSADSPTPSPRRPSFRPVRLLTVAVFALAGLIFWISFNTAKGTDLRSDESMLRLSDLIQERSRKNAKLDDSTARVRDQVDALTRGADEGGSKAAQARLKQLEGAAGTRPLSGSGLSVTLNDAPPNATPRIPGVPDPQPNDLVIHQQDLQAVVNALWQGGAEGIQVMDQRLISTSAVRCVGNTLILQGRLYSPPYKVTAVGDPEKLREALSASPAIQNYRQYVEAYGLGWKVDNEDAVTLPGYSGTVELHEAQPLK
ncbi:DUF881 domain-containing protein [Streptomyces sp. LX-29]|uniref:DUF881 domain-containing protein n=1 Tax=Streptomyces sp. LX-29 TaxID=2900152 RepID=UPI00240DAC1F|nr:DUF881 domain-containing protein [Streptomyces sp. LX-29]WFB08490.1 DUF881 domain-containing protein [Streptomyces sp. LX-29]